MKKILLINLLFCLILTADEKKAAVLKMFEGDWAGNAKYSFQNDPEKIDIFKSFSKSKFVSNIYLQTLMTYEFSGPNLNDKGAAFGLMYWVGYKQKYLYQSFAASGRESRQWIVLDTKTKAFSSTQENPEYTQNASFQFTDADNNHGTATFIYTNGLVINSKGSNKRQKDLVLKFPEIQVGAAVEKVLSRLPGKKPFPGFVKVGEVIEKEQKITVVSIFLQRTKTYKQYKFYSDGRVKGYIGRNMDDPEKSFWIQLN